MSEIGASARLPHTLKDTGEWHHQRPNAVSPKFSPGTLQRKLGAWLFALHRGACIRIKAGAVREGKRGESDVSAEPSLDEKRSPQTTDQISISRGKPA
jgi:hypothetical protein